MNWDKENKRHQTIFLLRNAQAQLICIIEEQQRTEQGTLTHTLGADEMNISIEFHLSIWDMGTIQKYDLFRYLMAVPPLLFFSIIGNRYAIYQLLDIME